VVITDSQLPDGRWHDMLRELRRRPADPPLIVASRLADNRLWAEVLNLGGYDVLATPFEAQEVVRSVSPAWRHMRDKRLAIARPAARIMVAGSEWAV
jgi:DNA-binding response OmpR family regulator